MRPGARTRTDSTGKVQNSPFVNSPARPPATVRPRAGTFVGDEHLSSKGGKAMTGTANEVTRTKLKSGPPIVGTDGTVFFKMHGDESPSQYAVASTRLARFLGMPALIAHNAFARIKGVEGVVAGRVAGVPMMAGEFKAERKPPKTAGQSELADWIKMSQVVKRGGKYYARSANVFPPVDLTDPGIQKGLSDLQLFDAISGQTDRHGGNIYIDPVTGAITGIDDDWSFGVGQPANDVEGRQKRGQYRGLPALVDESTAEAILRLDPDALPGELARRQNDTKALTPKQIDDARSRLVAVQAHLQGLKDRDALRREWNDETFRQASQDPDGSYLGRQAELLGRAVAGDDPGYKLASGPTIPQRPMIINPPAPTTTTVTLPPLPLPPLPPAPVRANVVLGARRNQPPQQVVPPPQQVLPQQRPLAPAPTLDLVPTRNRAVQPDGGLPPLIRGGDSPRTSATARLRSGGVNTLPGIGDPIVSVGDGRGGNEDRSSSEDDAAEQAEIDRLQDLLDYIVN